MSGKTGVKRKARTTEFKYQAILEVEHGGRSRTQVAKDLGVSTSTLATWLANKDSIRQRHDGHEPEAKRPRKPRYTLDFADPKPRVAEARPGGDDDGQEPETKKSDRRRPQYTLDFADPKPRVVEARPGGDSVTQEPKTKIPGKRDQRDERESMGSKPREAVSQQETNEHDGDDVIREAGPRAVTFAEAMKAIKIPMSFFDDRIPECQAQSEMMVDIFTYFIPIKQREMEQSRQSETKKK